MRKIVLTDRLSKTLAAFAALFLALNLAPAFVPTATAQDKQTQDEETAKQVLDLIRQGNSAFEQEDYEAAHEKYEAAYDLYPDPAILVRLGRTSEKLGNDQEAIGYFREFARLMPDDPTSEKLLARADELERGLPVVVNVASEPAGAQVFVGDAEGTTLGTTPLDIELEPGAHTLYLKREGFETTSQEIEVEPGTEREVSVTLSRTAVADTNTADTANADTSVRPVESDTIDVDTYGWVATGVGVAALATSGVFLYLKEDAEDDVNSYDKRAPGASRSELQELKDDANSYYDTALITGIAGGVLTATGIGLLTYHYINADADDEGVALQLDASFDSESAWLGVNGRF